MGGRVQIAHVISVNSVELFKQALKSRKERVLTQKRMFLLPKITMALTPDHRGEPSSRSVR